MALPRAVKELDEESKAETEEKPNIRELATVLEPFNVRSLALTLNQKGQLTNACEETLRGLREALAKRTLGGTR